MNEYAQKEDGWCGAAALSFALSQIGIDKDQERIVKDTGTTKSKGVDPSPLKKAAESYGAEVEIINGESAEKTLDLIDKEVKDGASVLVDYLVSGKEDGGHYVVFLGVSGNNIRIFDPSGGKKDEMEKSYFFSNWKDYTENGKVMKNWAMVLRA